MGRKPVPTNIKLLKGTAQPCRINKDEPKPRAARPSPPSHLHKYAKSEWKRIVPQLESLKLLTLVDRAALAAYCQTYARWRQAEEELNQSGLTAETSNGNVIQHPLVGIANTALTLMHKYLTEFGLTPSSRSKVTAVKDEPKKDAWAAI